MNTGLTPKGFAAPLVRWLLWSPRRVLLLAMALVLVIVAARVHGLWDNPTPPAATPAAPSSAPAPSPLPAPTAIPTPATPAPAPEDASVTASPVEVARTFALRWVDHDGVDPATWLARLQPLCDDQYGKITLPTVDPTTVPASRVTGAARLLNGAVNRAAQVRVPLDQLSIDVSLVDTTGAGHWVVDDIAPAAPTQ